MVWHLTRTPRSCIRHASLTEESRAELEPTGESLSHSYPEINFWSLCPRIKKTGLTFFSTCHCKPTVHQEDHTRNKHTHKDKHLVIYVSVWGRLDACNFYLILNREEGVCLYKCLHPPLLKTIQFSMQEKKPTLCKWWKVYSACPFLNSQVNAWRSPGSLRDTGSSTERIMSEVNSSSGLPAWSFAVKELSRTHTLALSLLQLNTFPVLVKLQKCQAAAFAYF